MSKSPPQLAAGQVLTKVQKLNRIPSRKMEGVSVGEDRFHKDLPRVHIARFGKWVFRVIGREVSCRHPGVVRVRELPEKGMEVLPAAVF